MQRSTCLLALLLAAPAAASAQGVSPRVIPTIPSGVTLTLNDFVVLPTFNGSPARPQFLMAAADGTTDLMATDENGIIYRVGANGTVTTYLDLTKQNISLIQSGGEEGLVGLAFHPDFNTPGAPGYGKFYTAFSAALHSGTPDFEADQDHDHEQVIGEWTAKDPTATTFSGTYREVLRVGKPYENHNGGVIAFNPNAASGTADYGKLYIGFGDGGAGNDPFNNGQNIESALGKILRIDPLPGRIVKYKIPADNPVIHRGGAAPLVWAMGLRNPQQFSFEHGPNGRMFIDDIGQLQVEEVNLGLKGANYGWQLREGDYATGSGTGEANGKSDYASYPRPSSDLPHHFVYPIAEFDHVDPDTGNVVNVAIGSGYAYQGTQVPALSGHYVFTDFAHARMFDIVLPNGESLHEKTTMTIEMSYHGQSYDTLFSSPLAAAGRPDLRLGEDANGELYALVKGAGAILKITSGSATAAAK